MNAIKTIHDFASAVKYALSEAFPECSIEIVPITKNNGVCLTGIAIRPHNRDISPTVYMDPYYAALRSCTQLESIIARITSDCRKAIDTAADGISADDIMDFAAAKDRICYKLINTELNSGLLADVPTRNLQDLSIVYYVHLSGTDAGTATTLITSRLAELWGTDEKTLYGLACRNTKHLHRGVVLSMSDVLGGITASDTSQDYKADAYDGFDISRSEPDILPMYVATNKDRTFGAAAVLYDGLLDAVAEKLGCDGVFALPSSVHEMLVIPDTFGDAGNIKDMVREINVAEVRADEVLSGNIYHYSVKGHDFKMVS